MTFYSILSRHVPGMLATCSVDKTVTLWDTYDTEQKLASEAPKAKLNKDMRVGKLYSVGFYPSSPWLLGCAGGAKEMALWDMTWDDNVQRCFGDRSIIPTEKSATAEKESGQMKEAFDAMMTTAPEDSPDKVDEMISSKSKKKGSKKKKKVHKAGR